MLGAAIAAECGRDLGAPDPQRARNSCACTAGHAARSRIRFRVAQALDEPGVGQRRGTRLSFAAGSRS
jgi:hypothetical protein